MKAVASFGCARHPFAQQALPSFRPVIKPICMYITLSIFAALFLIIGIVGTLHLATMKEVSIRYDDKCGFNTTCDVKLNVTSEMKGELVLFYKLTNFGQNQRRYVESRSTEQLMGEYVSFDALSTLSYRTRPDEEEIEKNMLLPSGLAPYSFCNDTYEIDGINFSETGIAWSADIEMYKPLSDQYTTGDFWLDNYTDFPGGQTNEHFIVWMRFGSQRTLIKKFGICKDCTLKAGDHTVIIKNNYPTDGFLGEKWVGVYENTRFGPRNPFFGGLAFAYAVVWLLCILATVLIQLLRPRKDGDKRKITKRIMKISGAQ